jgi:hypothetical protein
MSAFHRALRAFGSARRALPGTPADLEVSVEKDPFSDEVVVVESNRQVREPLGCSVAFAHWGVEVALHRSVARNLPRDRVLLHAGCVKRGERAFLFVGDSGAGKSSHCLLAVQSGYSYMSDDGVVTDGVTLWGIPRAIQFDPPAQEVPFPQWLTEAPLDMITYAGDESGQPNGRPLFVPGRERTIDELSASDVTVVVLERGENESIQPLRAPEVLAHLINAAYYPPLTVDLGRLASGGGCKLTWSHPRASLSLLERTFGDPM